MFLQWLCPALPWGAPEGAFRPGRHTSDTIGKQSDRVNPVSFKFHGGADQDLSSEVQESFEAMFKRELASINAWFVQENWTPHHHPDLQVFVSTDYKISRALVPAWNGQCGRVEFPAWRVGAGKAAIIHELTHVYFPNGNRFLAEGLAIYLQAILGKNSAFPNFGQPLHEQARDRLREMAPAFRSGDVASLDAVRLDELDAIPTPNPLTLEAARRFYREERHVQGGIYSIAGSFLQFLIETYGLSRFSALYGDTPLRAGELDAGLPERWLNAYGYSLEELEAQWKFLIVGACPDTTELVSL